MKSKYLFSILLCLPMTGCFMAQKSAVVVSKQSYDSTSQARIRLYGPYGAATIHRYNETACDDWRGTSQRKIHHRVNNGLPRKIKNISTGMPETARSLAASNDTGIMFRDSFKEYVVTANKPITLDGSESDNTGTKMPGYSVSCRVAVSFIPKPNTDYEASYIETNNTCSIQITEVQKDKQEKTIFPTRLLEPSEVQMCSKPTDSSI